MVRFLGSHRFFSDFPGRVKFFAVVSGIFNVFSVVCLFSLVLLCFW